MRIESEVFSRYAFRREALLNYGFIPEGETLTYTKALAEDDFEIILVFDSALRGKINDLAAGGEYVNFRNENASGYSAGIRQKFTDLLLDIRKNCCTDLYFSSAQAVRIGAAIGKNFGCAPEFLWPNLPTFAAFRRGNSGKWFAVVGNVPRNKVDKTSPVKEAVEVINVKVDEAALGSLLQKRGYYPAYHMNKKSWASIILDDTLPDEEILLRISESYESV